MLGAVYPLWPLPHKTSGGIDKMIREERSPLVEGQLGLVQAAARSGPLSIRSSHISPVLVKLACPDKTKRLF